MRQVIGQTGCHITGLAPTFGRSCPVLQNNPPTIQAASGTTPPTPTVQTHCKYQPASIEKQPCCGLASAHLAARLLHDGHVEVRQVAHSVHVLCVQPRQLGPVLLLDGVELLRVGGEVRHEQPHLVYGRQRIPILCRWQQRRQRRKMHAQPSDADDGVPAAHVCMRLQRPVQTSMSACRHTCCTP